jgi:sn-glycerol 3-phosphate transport system permease protein
MARRREALLGWLLVLPAVLLLGTFTHFPAVLTVWHALHTKPVPGHPSRFDAWDNFGAMLDDPVFRQALGNNLFYGAVLIPTTIVLALVMALAVNGRMPGRSFLRLAYFTPTVLPMIAVANIWLFFFTPGYGLFAQILAPFGLGSLNWLGEPTTALPAVTMIAVWKAAGFYMIFYLAALQAIPPNLAEAAALEGASRFTFFRRVLWPLLMPTTLFVFVNVTIDSFRLVDQVVVLTHGGPDNTTLLLLYYVYQVAFQYFDANYASALTVVIVAVLCLLAILQFGVIGRRVHYR